MSVPRCPHSLHGNPETCSQCAAVPVRRVDLAPGGKPAAPSPMTRAQQSRMRGGAVSTARAAARKAGTGG